MPQVCTDRNLRISSGVLGLEKWSAPRLVASSTVASTGDGAITGAGLTSQPGRLMIDASLSWTSDSPLTQMIRLQVIRAYRTIIVSSPNAIQIWDSWQSAVGGVGVTARAPDNFSAANGITTLGMDIGTDTNALPYYGRVHQDYPASATEDWIELPAGQTIHVRYRAYCWTPPPWSPNASANSPLHEAWARQVKLWLWAYPTADQAVR